MRVHLRRSVVAACVFLILCGLAYPLAATGISQLVFHHQANGSLTPYGSTLIGQPWTGPVWFQGRPDGQVLTTGPGKVVVSGTNQPGPRSKVLEEEVAKEAALLKREGIIPTEDLVTTSGSLLDPDITPADAYAQAGAIASRRSLPQSVVRRLIAEHVHTRQFGFLGADYINVLELNVALSRLR